MELRLSSTAWRNHLLTADGDGLEISKDYSLPVRIRLLTQPLMPSALYLEVNQVKLFTSYLNMGIFWRKVYRNLLLQWSNHELLSVCTRLPDDWVGVKTNREFPVEHGSPIAVSCQEGYINTGSEIVICNTYLYQEFDVLYSRKPRCSPK